jgi:threonylcarbamoyladenosine tRNA methylthiotransferase MtaB
MNRGYTSREFLDKVDLCRKMLPDAAIGIDVLVGFPGEADQHFANTCALLQELDCTYLHVFPYSQRPGTLAATFDQQVPQVVKEERVAILRQLDGEKKELFYQRYLGATRPVLVEHKRGADGNLRGFTDNYIPVSFPGHHSLMNTITPVTLTTALQPSLERAASCRPWPSTVSMTRVSGRIVEANHAG